MKRYWRAKPPIPLTAIRRNCWPICRAPHANLAKKPLKPWSRLLSGTDEALAGEAGDLLYHLLVVLVARGVTLDQLTDVLAARAGTSGLDEKAARDA